MGDVLGDHGFAQALRGDEHDVAGLGDEFETQRGLDDGVAVDGAGPVPVEVAERVNDFETGRMINYALLLFTKQASSMGSRDSACGGLIQT